METMLHSEDISKRLVLDVQNRFAALADLSDNVEEARSVFSHTIHESAEKTIGYKQHVKAPWMSNETYSVLPKIAKAH